MVHLSPFSYLVHRTRSVYSAHLPKFLVQFDDGSRGLQVGLDSAYKRHSCLSRSNHTGDLKETRIRSKHAQVSSSQRNLHGPVRSTQRQKHTSPYSLLDGMQESLRWCDENWGVVGVLVKPSNNFLCALMKHRAMSRSQCVSATTTSHFSSMSVKLTVKAIFVLSNIDQLWDRLELDGLQKLIRCTSNNYLLKV